MTSALVTLTNRNYKISIHLLLTLGDDFGEMLGFQINWNTLHIMGFSKWSDASHCQVFTVQVLRIPL